MEKGRKMKRRKVEEKKGKERNQEKCHVDFRFICDFFRMDFKLPCIFGSRKAFVSMHGMKIIK